MSLSLKQQISNNTSNLQTQIDTLSSDVSSAVAFHKDIITSDANVKVLIDRSKANATDIDTLESTTSTQTGQISSLQTSVGDNASEITRITSVFNTDIASLESTKQPNLISSSIVDVNEVVLHDQSSASTRVLNFTSFVGIESALGSLNDGINAEVNRAVAVEDILNGRITSEMTRAKAKEASIESNVDFTRNVLNASIASEKVLSDAADATLQANIDTEASARSGAITSEAASRVAGDNKMCFCNVMEFEGVLATGDYPFACGYGSPSGPGFGMPIPFNSKVVGYSLVCVSSDVKLNVSMTMEHHRYSDGGINPVADFNLVSADGSNKNVSAMPSNSAVLSAGNLCVKVSGITELVGANGVIDPYAKYRLAVYLQSQVEF